MDRLQGRGINPRVLRAVWVSVGLLVAVAPAALLMILALQP